VGAVREHLILAPEQRRKAFLDMIGDARQRIRLSMFRCTDFKIMDALAEALSRGVAVDLLLTQRAKGWERKIRELGQYLESMGAHVHRYGEHGIKYHAKYMVADGSRALITSQNLMKRYFEKTSDYLLETSEPEVTASLDCLFRHDLEHHGQDLPVGLSSRLIVGPEISRRRFREVLEGARRSIVIADHRVTDPEMLTALGRAEDRGVLVRVLGKGAIAGLKSHGKAMVIDGAMGILGSISLSLPSLDMRRELAVFFNEPALVAELEEFLQKSGQGVGMAEVRVAAMAGAGDDDEDEGEEDADE
jgi:phosphatidylserine/phosphatidylglycerophosphate/cardiolipin synthase-like enzyme